MYRANQKGQGAVWVILIIAIVALIVLWISRNPSSPISITAPETADTVISPSEPSSTPTPSKSLVEIEQTLKELNSSSAEIDKGINDTQLDITL